VGRADLVKLLYRLGRQRASGVLTVSGGGARDEVFVLRRGAILCPHAELAQRTLTGRLARLVAIDGTPASGAQVHANGVAAIFAGGVTAAPPGPQQQLFLAEWARAHLEQQLDRALGESLLFELAGARLTLRPELAPEPQDDADRRLLAAMAQPRRLDQIWPLARTPRFRLLAFVHFLRSVDALEVEGVGAPRVPSVLDVRRRAAMRVLGVPADAGVDQVKRAYRRLARTLHPDLQPELDAERRRWLERRFAEVTAAYETLV
jgi:DnaJ-domain-containing protein 1